MTGKITFRPQDPDPGYIVYLDGDLIGWVAPVDRRGLRGAVIKMWTATDTYMVPVRGERSSRVAAVRALVKRYEKEAPDA